ncbi:class I SAM-dependent methyltransferase [Candidatus Falkowbacteria bacterium]|nr:class I SAM-dependent methyltransferase [Candidatus Falkowbacteria bacterium]
MDELMLMTASVVYFKPTHIFDWGTYVGKSARIFYEIVRFYKLKSEIHSIDLPDDILRVENPGKNRGRMVRGKKNVFLHQGDGVQKSLEILNNKNVDARPLFFVDGDHSFRVVSSELSVIKKSFPNAPILVHDTFYQLPVAGYNTGPYSAVKELISDGYINISTQMGLPGMTLLYKLTD